MNDAFCRNTGYERAEVIGRNCRFLQGEGTRDEDRRHIAEAVAAEREVSVDILNYRADGTRFINRLVITPLPHESAERVRYFLGVQIIREGDVSQAERAEQLDEQVLELQHRVKNHLAMILAMIRLEANAAASAQDFAEVLARRVESLSLLYDEFAVAGAAGGEEEVALGAYLSRVAASVHAIGGRPGVRVNIDADAMRIDLDRAARLGLYLSEVLSNSFQHAFDGDWTGEIRLSLRGKPDGKACLSVEDDGRGLGAESWPRPESLGGRIVLALIDRMQGTLSTEALRDDAERPGTRTTLRFPALNA